MSFLIALCLATGLLGGCTSEQVVRAFQTALLDSGHQAMLRTTRGDDIGAACGQLVGRVKDRTRRQARYQALALKEIA